MAQRSLNSATFTPTATADTTALVDNTHMSIQGNSGTQRVSVSEIWIGGQAVASAVNIMVFARHSTFGLTPTLGTNGKDAVLDPSAPAGTAQGYMSAATDPQRSATLGLLNMTFNAFGGIARWQPAVGKEIWILGNTASLGEAGLSAFTGGNVGAVGAHIIYEPL